MILKSVLYQILNFYRSRCLTVWPLLATFLLLMTQALSELAIDDHSLIFFELSFFALMIPGCIYILYWSTRSSAESLSSHHLSLIVTAGISRQKWFTSSILSNLFLATYCGVMSLLIFFLITKSAGYSDLPASSWSQFVGLLTFWYILAAIGPLFGLLWRHSEAFFLSSLLVTFGAFAPPLTRSLASSKGDGLFENAAYIMQGFDLSVFLLPNSDLTSMTTYGLMLVVFLSATGLIIINKLDIQRKYGL